MSAWSRVLVTRSFALAPTLVVALLAGAPNQLDILNQWLNILQSIQLPFAIIPVRSARLYNTCRTPCQLSHIFVMIKPQLCQCPSGWRRC